MSFDVYKLRKDFPILNKENAVAYFDNSATTFKPVQVIQKMNEYYLNYPSNVHRGEYELSITADTEYDNARKTVASYVHARWDEIIFTSGTTDSLNQAAYGLGKLLQKNDEIIISEHEHSSNVLPWFRLQEDIGIKVVFVPLNSDGKVTLDNLKKVVNNRTKVISLAHVTNVLGYAINVKEITKFAHKNGIIVVIDGAQAIPHMRIDLEDLDVDFYAFSGHKMFGPTGIGVLYGKKELLEKIPAMRLGGGMNNKFDKTGFYSYKETPTKFEAGTPPIAEAIGLAEAIRYLEAVMNDDFEQHIGTLHKYLLSELSKIPGIYIYNPHADIGIVTFNYKNVFSQDMATFFNSKHLAVRSGQHCAKILNTYLNTPGTVRISLYAYNTIEEVQQLIAACKKGDEYLDAYFGS